MRSPQRPENRLTLLRQAARAGQLSPASHHHALPTGGGFFWRGRLAPDEGQAQAGQLSFVGQHHVVGQRAGQGVDARRGVSVRPHESRVRYNVAIGRLVGAEDVVDRFHAVGQELEGRAAAGARPGSLGVVAASECGKSSRFGLLPYWTAMDNLSTVLRCPCGSITNGLCAASSFGCLTTCVRKTQEPFDAFAFEYGCQEECGVEGKPGGAAGESPGVCHPSPVGL